jgi:flagellin-like protein
MKVQRRRGLSPIITELLLIAVTVTIGSSLFFVASSAISNFTNGYSFLFGASANQAKEIYVVEYANFVSGTPNYVNITIRNVGLIETQVADIGFFGTGATATSNSFAASSGMIGTSQGSLCSFANGIVTIPVGKFCTLKVSLAWTNAATYNMVVSTQRGNSITLAEVA